MIPIPKIEGRRGLAILIDASGPRWEADTAEGIRAFSEADDVSLVIWVGSRNPEALVAHVEACLPATGAPHVAALLEPEEYLSGLIQSMDLVAAIPGEPHFEQAKTLGIPQVMPDGPSLRLAVEARMHPWLLDRRSEDWCPSFRPASYVRNPEIPLTSLLIPTYNRLAGLEACLHSVLAQDLDELEIVISDNASTDGTWECVNDLTGHDSRVRRRRNPENLGWTRNMEALLEASTGPLVKFVFSDDILAPGALQRLREPLLHEPGVVISTGPWTMIDGEGRPIEGAPECSLPLPDGVVVPGPEVIRLLFSRCANFVGSHSVPLLRRDVLKPRVGHQARWATLLWAFDLGNWMDALQQGDLAYIGGAPVLAFRNPPRPPEALAERVAGIYGDLWDLVQEALESGLLNHEEALRASATFLFLAVPNLHIPPFAPSHSRLQAAAEAAGRSFRDRLLAGV